MRVRVRRLYMEGRVIKKDRDVPLSRGSVGDLKIYEDRDHSLQRVVRVAALVDVKDGKQVSLLPELLDADVLFMDERIMRLTGNELVGGRYTAQTWHVETV